MPDADIRIISGDKINRENYDHHQDTFIGFKMAAEYVDPGSATGNRMNS